LDKCFGFASGCTVADGDCFNLELFAKCLDHGCCGCDLSLGAVWVDSIVVKQLALLVQADELAACAEARIEREHGLLAEWRGEEQLAHVLGEDADCFFVGLLLCGEAHFGFHCR